MTHRSIRSASARRPLRRLGALAIAAVLAACGGNSASDTTDAPTPDGSGNGVTVPATDAPVLTNAPTTTNPELVPQAGGSLTIAVEGESTGFSPANDGWARGGHQIARAIFDPLATYDAEGKVVPYLAEAFTANADSTVWIITLRPGITFHNGEPLDAAAVKANFDAVLASAQSKAQLSLVSGMTVVDDLNLEIQMSAPWGPFPQALVGEVGTQVGYMAAPAMLADPNGGRTPIGTGPFRFVEWVPDDHLTVARNDDYWQDPAYLDEVTFRPIPDTTSRQAAFDAGDVDIYYTGSSQEITEYQESSDVTTFIGTPIEPDMLMFNVTAPPMDDVRVRRALAMSLEIPVLFDFLEATGVKQPLDGPYAESSFWHVESDYPEYDPEEAARLVEEYEAEIGPVEFNFSGNQDPFLVSYQELFQAMWAEVGAEANIVSKAQGENINDVLAGNYQVIMWGGQGGGDPDRDYNYFHSGGLNFTRYTTPEIDAALDAGRALSDPEERKAQYAIIQEAFGRDVPYVWIGTNTMAVITQGDVMGIADFDLPDGNPGTPVAAGMFFLKDVWLVP